MQKQIYEEAEIPKLRECLRLFSKSDKKRIFAVTGIQIILGALDLLGIIIIGVLTSVAINGLQSRPAGDRVMSLLEFLNIQQFSLQIQSTILGVSAASTLILKTLLSIYFSRKILFFLGRRSAYFSGLLLANLYKKDILAIQHKSQQEMVYALTGGMNAVVVSVIGSLVLLVSDSTLVLILSLGLFVLDPTTAFISVAIFSVLAVMLYFILRSRAIRLGSMQSTLMVEVNERLLQSLVSYRELRVRNQLEKYVSDFSISRRKVSEIAAEMNFLPNISKYVLEIAIVIGAITVSSVQFFTNNATRAISVLAIFLAASTRLAPAVLRIQQGFTSIQANLANSALTMYFIRKFGMDYSKLDSQSVVKFNYSGFRPKINMKNLSFQYPMQEFPIIKEFSFDIPEGSMTAIVGPSGAGKSTLVDLMLGVLDTQSGEIRISDVDPKQAFKRWPGAVSYVPQQINIINGSIFENVTFGSNCDELSEERVRQSLKLAQLEDLVKLLKDDIFSQVGDKGARLSGGQRQRIGLARALYSNPLLLVLDEATNSLDSATEEKFTDTLLTLKGKVTLVVIAHRLSTVKAAEAVVYLDKGKAIACGTFDEVKSMVPDFALQAQLQGL